MRYVKYLLIVFVIVLSGCSKDNEFYKEYTKYNNRDNYVDVDIDGDSVFEYYTNDEINDIIKNDSGVIFIGNGEDNLSRVVVNVLDKVVSNTDIDVVYCNNNKDIVSEYINEDISIPVVLFVFEGEVSSYHIGTINDSYELSNDEEIELYNIYLEGVHQVLNDVCDERC